MKKLVSLFLIGFITITYAQKGSSNFRMKQLTTEQQTILQTKHMVLTLDLNKLQESKLLSLNQDQAESREKMRSSHKTAKQNEEELSAEEIFNMKNEMLDVKIKYQSEIKKILTEKQFELWHKNQKERYSAYRHKAGSKTKQKHKMKGKS